MFPGNRQLALLLCENKTLSLFDSAINVPKNKKKTHIVEKSEFFIIFPEINGNDFFLIFRFHSYFSNKVFQNGTLCCNILKQFDTK